MSQRMPGPSDRERVTDAVVRAGRAGLVFSKAAVLEELRNLGGVGASSPSTVDRHLAALLEGKAPLLRQLGSSLDTILEQPLSSRQERRPYPKRAGAARYVLSERWAVLDEPHLDVLDDVGRTLIACELARYLVAPKSGVGVPTRIVTSCLRVVPGLTLTTIQDTNVLLQRLASPPYRVVMNEGTRRGTASWRVVVALRRGWLRWIQEMVDAHVDALAGAQALARTRMPSVAQLAGRLLDVAVRQTQSSTWPHGHPITIRECRGILEQLAAQEGPSGDTRGALAVVGRTRGGLDAALRDAARGGEGDGKRRRTPLVRTTGSSEGRAPTYAPASLPAAVVTLWHQWKLLEAKSSREAREWFTREWGLAIQPANPRSPTLDAWRACAQVTLARAIRADLKELRALEVEASRFSARLLSTVKARRERLESLIAKVPPTVDLERTARTLLRPLRATLEKVLAERPEPMHQDAFAALIPESRRAGRTPAQLIGGLRGVRHFVPSSGNPKTRVGQGRVPAIHLDPRDAIPEAAAIGGLPGGMLLHETVGRLGRCLSSVDLLTRMATEAEPLHRLTAITGLVVIGHPERGGRIVKTWLRDSSLLQVPRLGVGLVELAFWLPGDVRSDIIQLAEQSRVQLLLRALQGLRAGLRQLPLRSHVQRRVQYSAASCSPRHI